MSFVGKILVVFQFVLAVLFVAFAGVVYTAHMNWRDDSIKKQGQITRLQADKSTAEQALESAKSAFNAQKVELDQTIAQLDAARKGLEQQVAQMKKENGDLQVARKTASEQAVIAG